jgi:GTP cyclohydrolase II/3,4-dihydroxy 2-butanone 4-phosphate synthase/GTP cyclohydrolase II
VYGEPKNGSLVRVHSECLTGDVFHASNCDCGNQLHYACSEIVKAGSGIVIYMRGQEGRGNGLSNKVKAVNLEASEDLDTVDAHRALGLPVENRHFDVAVKIIKDFFHLTAITLLTNNPIKIVPFEQAGILVKRRAGWVKETAQNRRYLETKINRMGHYPDGRVSGDFDNTLDPIEFFDRSSPLANFYPSAIVVGDRTYTTVEHFYQASKFTHRLEIYEEIASAPSPLEAKALSRKHKNSIRSDWDKAKEEIMHLATVEKYIQHPDLCQFLLNTGDHELVEKSPEDAYWGRTPKGGLNRMGIILMKVRGELRERQRVVHLRI